MQVVGHWEAYTFFGSMRGFYSKNYYSDYPVCSHILSCACFLRYRWVSDFPEGKEQGASKTVKMLKEILANFQKRVIFKPLHKTILIYSDSFRSMNRHTGMPICHCLSMTVHKHAFHFWCETKHVGLKHISYILYKIQESIDFNSYFL